MARPFLLCVWDCAPQGSPPGRAATIPRGRSRVELRGSQTHRGNGGCRAIRGACFFGYFLCTSKESTSPAVREPHLIISYTTIAPEARSKKKCAQLLIPTTNPSLTHCRKNPAARTA